MKQPPVIVLQFIHIAGPLKGKIEEFTEERLLVGRHPSCHLRFPPDLTLVSRHHAEILREGNRIRLIDRSTNGTLLNGKPVAEAPLKNGDVLTFAEGGPKVSFLMELREAPPGPEISPSLPRIPEPERPAERQPRGSSTRDAGPGASPPPVAAERTQSPLVVQFGPTLRTFRELPVVFGRGDTCEVALPQPSLQERHAQIFFARGRYWVKDLTGRDLVRVGGRPAGDQSPLEPDAVLSLGPEGPSFRFLGEGRLAEVPTPGVAPSRPPERPGPDRPDGPAGKPPSRRKFFR